MPRIPEWMQDNFRQGIVYHEEGKSGDGVMPQTVREARQGAEDGDLPDNKPRRMAAWFARHMADLDGTPERGDPDYPTPGQVAHLLWGGGVSKPESERAQRWAEREVARQERESASNESGDVMAVTDEIVTGDDKDDDEMYAALPSEAVLVVATEGERTSDGRMADVGALSWRELPLVLTVNHDPNQRVGRLDAMARVQSADGLTVANFDDFTAANEGPVIVAKATFNLDTEMGRGVAAEVRDGFLSGVSMEVGDEVVEYDDDNVMHLMEGRIGAVSVVVFQAIETARVVETASVHVWRTPEIRLEREALVAASIPTVPPAAWFADPGLDGPTAIVVDEDGRVFGHLALWGTCHTGRPADVCLTPPRSDAGYAYFLTGYVSADDNGVEVQTAVGSVTMATGHASTRPGVSAAAAIAHYEHTGYAVADVVAGEDEHGIWLAGGLRPSVSAEQVRELRGASLSGDWRSIGGNLELVAALAVNVPGFPVPRVQAGLAASGVQTALVAAGVELDSDCGCGDDDGVERRLARLESLVSVLDLSAEAVTRLAARLA
jgi:hypothetical protein